jgi:DNA-binding NarL/FixJ family response regulator
MSTVVAAEFEDLVAIGLEVMIGEDPGLELVARGVSMDDIHGVVEEHSPSVVLLNFGALGGPEEVRDLHEAFPDAHIVVLGSRPTAGDCAHLLSLGATGCLSKDTDAEAILSALHLAAHGMHVLPRSAASGRGTTRLSRRGMPLTEREDDVLELLQDGCTNAEIADRLDIAVETVRSHARSIYRKLGVPSRRELTRVARREPVLVDETRRPLTPV